MSRVKGKDTTPELRVRQLAHAMGLRFRLHRKDLPGRPDLVFPKYRVALFVHGCFWHRHPNCPKASSPKTRPEFWQSKFERNVERDQRNIEEITALGWNALVLWECETKDPANLSRRLESIFERAI